MVGKIAERKHLSADALFSLVKSGFARIPDHRSRSIGIALPDALMSAFAMFSLKCPSLLEFDEQKRNDENLQSIYKIGKVPCDTQMRTILDAVDPVALRPMFRDVFRQVQRGKVLEQFVYLEGCYLLALDGTGYFSSGKLHCPSCMEKVSRDGSVTYYHQMLGAVLIHPGLKEVIPLCPEPIIKQDGATKNDCERNAARRFLGKFRQDHPHLGVIVVEDGLSSNAPHIRDLMDNGMHFILVVKEGDHPFLFSHVEERENAGEVIDVEVHDRDPNSGVRHLITIVHDVPLNESNQDLLLDFVRYIEVNEEKDSIRVFTWVTDFKAKRSNVWKIVCGGRSRWHIENETFNTLKNQGYHLEHNYGHGNQNLSVNLALVMMLAFLVDQVLQRSSRLFQAAWQKLRRKRTLWQNMRSLFEDFSFQSMNEVYATLFYGHKKLPPEILDSS